MYKLGRTVKNNPKFLDYRIHLKIPWNTFILDIEEEYVEILSLIEENLYYFD